MYLQVWADGAGWFDCARIFLRVTGLSCIHDGVVLHGYNRYMMNWALCYMKLLCSRSTHKILLALAYNALSAAAILLLSSLSFLSFSFHLILPFFPSSNPSTGLRYFALRCASTIS